jgi:hypothetical protein
MIRIRQLGKKERTLVVYGVTIIINEMKEESRYSLSSIVG